MAKATQATNTQSAKTRSNEKATMKTSENDSTEGLLNFLNNASSSVKSVLTKPSCFKRNTNHRRFIQKQLKVSKQRCESPLQNLKLIPKQQFALNKVRQRTTSRKRTQLIKKEASSLKMSTTIQRSEIEYQQNNEQFISTMKIGDQNNFQRDIHYFAECKKFSEMVDELVDNLLDSTPSCSQDERLPTFEVPSHPYSRSGSVSSYSSSSEEEINPEFLSGEELLRCLDISELFKPESPSGSLHDRSTQEEQHQQSNELQIVPGDESPIPEHLMYETDITDTQSMPVFETVFQQFSL